MFLSLRLANQIIFRRNGMSIPTIVIVEDEFSAARNISRLLKSSNIECVIVRRDPNGDNHLEISEPKEPGPDYRFDIDAFCAEIRELVGETGLVLLDEDFGRMGRLGGEIPERLPGLRKICISTQYPAWAQKSFDSKRYLSKDNQRLDEDFLEMVRESLAE